MYASTPWLIASARRSASTMGETRTTRAAGYAARTSPIESRSSRPSVWAPTRTTSGWVSAAVRIASPTVSVPQARPTSGWRSTTSRMPSRTSESASTIRTLSPGLSGDCGTAHLPGWRGRKPDGSLDLCEDDLAAGGERVELADRDDPVHVLDEVLGAEAEQVDRRLARVEARAGVRDHLHELGDRRDVELLHLLRELVRHERRHAREPAHPRCQVQAGLADRGHLHVIVARPVDRVEPEEREEEIRLDALHAGAVGHDQPGIDALERSARDDDGDLVDGVAHG